MRVVFGGNIIELFINIDAMKICELFEDQSTSVLPYGYWITSDGTIIPVKEVMGHGRYTENGTHNALTHGWIRIVVNGNRYMSSHNRVLYVQVWSKQNYSKNYIQFENLCSEILDHHFFNSIMVEYESDFEEFEGKNFIKDAANFIKNYGRINEDGGRFVQGVNSTIDVHAGTMKHNAACFGNDVDDDGVPPIAKTNGARPDKIVKKHSYLAPVDQRDIPSNPSNPKPSKNLNKKTKI